MFKYLTVIFLCLLISMGCSSNTATDDEIETSETDMKTEGKQNLIDPKNVTEGSWISSAGIEREDEDMLYTAKIDYDYNKNYHLSHGSYVSYYKGEEFIETVLHEEGNPIDVEKFEEADNIVVSFRTAFIDSFELYENWYMSRAT